MAYTKTTDFASKDSLLSGDPSKVVLGSEIDTEFENIETVIGTTTGSGAVVLATSPTLVTPVLGTPASGTVTNLTGTASININGTVGATTPASGAFTTLTTTGNVTLGDASGDSVTINASTVSCANGLNFDSNTFVIDATNNRVGLGTSSPGEKLHVYGNAVDTAAKITKNGTDSIQVGIDSEAYLAAGGVIALRTGGFTSAYDKAKLDASGNFLVGVTSATINGGKIETSNGITFPATQSACSNANTLDDYEEGTWTATVTFGGANVGMTYATRTAHYVKVGSTCFFQLYLRLSAKGSSTGLAVVGGLPFTSDGSSAYSAVAVSIYDPIAGTAIASTTATVGSSSTNISLYSTTGGTLLYLTQGSFTDDTAVVVSGHYKVA